MKFKAFCRDRDEKENRRRREEGLAPLPVWDGREWREWSEEDIERMRRSIERSLGEMEEII